MHDQVSKKLYDLEGFQGEPYLNFPVQFKHLLDTTHTLQALLGIHCLNAHRSFPF